MKTTGILLIVSAPFVLLMGITFGDDYIGFMALMGILFFAIGITLLIINKFKK